MTSIRAITLTLAFAFLAACGGGASDRGPAAATSLEYTNPAGGGWRLAKDPSSTATRVVLNLVGPPGKKGRGAGFNLRSDGTVKFAKFDNGSYVNDLGVFQLTNKRGTINVIDGSRVTHDVGLLVGGVKDGGRLLSVGAFQKDRRWPAQDLEQALYQVAIELDPAQPIAAGTAIPLTVVKARSIPEDIGDNPDDPNANPATWVYQYKIDDIAVTAGTLVAR